MKRPRGFFLHRHVSSRIETSLLGLLMQRLTKGAFFFFSPPSRQSPQRARQLVGSRDTRFGSCNWFTEFPSKELNFALLSSLTMELQLVASLLTCFRTGHDWNQHKYLFDAVKWVKNLIP